MGTWRFGRAGVGGGVVVAGRGAEVRCWGGVMVGSDSGCPLATLSQLVRLRNSQDGRERGWCLVLGRRGGWRGCVLAERTTPEVLGVILVVVFEVVLSALVRIARRTQVRRVRKCMVADVDVVLVCGCFWLDEKSG